MNTPARLSLIVLLFLSAVSQSAAQSSEAKDRGDSVLRRENLVAWCYVPFDAAKRSPAERAEMLHELGILRGAYDWRQQHVPTFEQEILEYRKHGVEMFAFWSEHDEAFRLFEKYGMHPQIWRMLEMPEREDETQDAKIARAVQWITPLAERTKKMKCKLGLYNHGGWAGEPENLVAVCDELRELGHDHVGIVYNFHHAHDRIDQFASLLRMMLPYLHCLNLNGMNDDAQPKIVGLGKGQHEKQMLQAVLESGYDGPIGILDHRPELDARESLDENLKGLRWLERELQKPGSGGAMPPTPVPVRQSPAGNE
ncbi:MAG: TIM barrel protein [Planctomycetota bacterium]